MAGLARIGQGFDWVGLKLLIRGVGDIKSQRRGHSTLVDLVGLVS